MVHIYAEMYIKSDALPVFTQLFSVLEALKMLLTPYGGFVTHTPDSDREISRTLQMHRKTVRKYRHWAEQHSLIQVEKLPPVERIQEWLIVSFGQSRPSHMVSTVEPYREQVIQWRGENLSKKAIWVRLQNRGYIGSYGSVIRFVSRLEKENPLSRVTVRVEKPPGEEAQVDFGYAGKMLDEESQQEKRAWAFVMTLSWSRHQYVEFVFNQKVETWLRCHRRAFAFFSGVPQRVVVDNLKAAIVQACFEEPQAQLAYRECAEHYGFLIAPCRPYTPEHKGKVERSVQYVKRNFLATFEGKTIQQANKAIRSWCLETAGLRTHGTTHKQPLVQFQQTEQEVLKSLPAEPYDLAVWKQTKCHRDGYIVFDKGYYSLPYRLIGQQVRVRGGIDMVRIYTTDYQLVASHPRLKEAGGRQTNHAHLPPTHLEGLLMTRGSCLQMAQEMGEAIYETAHAILSDSAVDHLPAARRLIRLGKTFGQSRLEAACSRANLFGDPTYKTVKRILVNNLDAQPVPAIEAVHISDGEFARSTAEIFGAWVEGVQWNS